MKTERFKILSFSDVHLGCDRIDQMEMVTLFENILFEWIPKVKLVTIVGDLFDDSIVLSNSGAIYILDFITKFLHICDENNVTVRLLRGTFSHDRNQCQAVKSMADSMNVKNDVKYYDKIDVEYIKELDLKIGYIPDDLSPSFKTSQNAIELLKDKMLALGFDNLDYVLFHGYAEHVLPPKAHPKYVFNADQFPFVKKCVLAGHIHQHSSFRNFYYHGSLDRLAFNEEDSKGFLIVHDYKDSYSVRFIENTNAHIFKTLDYSKIETGITERFRKDIEPYKDSRQTVYIRVIHPDGNIRIALRNFVNEHYPNIKFFHTSPKNKTVTKMSEDIIIDQGVELRTYSVNTLPDDIYEYIRENKLEHVSKDTIVSVIDEFM